MEAVNTSTTNKKPFEIKKWIPTALWSWVFGEDICAACRISLKESCSFCEDMVATECPIVIASCKKHGFHSHCKAAYLKNENSCPFRCHPKNDPYFNIGGEEEGEALE